MSNRKKICWKQRDRRGEHLYIRILYVSKRYERTRKKKKKKKCMIHTIILEND